MWQSHRPGIKRLAAAVDHLRACRHRRPTRRAPTAVIMPLSTTTVWSARNRVASASNRRTPVNATGPAGTLTSDLASPGACAAIAFACASSIFDCSPAYASGSQARPKATPKNLLFASAQIGSGDVLMPVIAHSVIVCRRRAAADLEVGQLGGARLAAGQQVERLVGAREQRSRNHAVVSIGPPCDDVERAARE